MRFGWISSYIKVAAISLIIVIVFALPGLPASAAAGTAVVSVSAPTQAVIPGSQFTISITIQPNNAIAGAQFNLAFNPSLVTVNSISEGNLLKQNGASTYFSPGQINNTAGTLTGVAGAITSPGQTVSTQGTFATITMTAGSIKGTSYLTLSNIVVGDINGQTLPVSATNGQISIDRAPVLNTIGGKTATIGSLLSFTISATDADGDALTYSASGLPSGASFNAATQAFSWTPSLGQAGTYINVNFAVSDGLVTTNQAISITVNKMTPVFSNLSAPGIAYGTSPTNLGGTIKSGSYIPSGNISITLNGVQQTVAIDASGNFSSSFGTGSLTTSGSPYTISYVYAGDSNFIAASDSTRTLTVNNIAATVSLSNLNQTYDGTAKSVTAITSPTGLSVSTTYNGSVTVPAAAGSYSVVATVTSPNYSGSATGTLTIAKITPVFSNLSAPTINYGSTPTSLSGTLKSGALIPTGTISITLNSVTQTAVIDGLGNFTSSFGTGSLTNSGSPYTISYVYGGDTNFTNTSDTTKTFTVNKITAVVSLSNLNQTYNGTARSVTATTNPTGLSLSITYNGSASVPVAAGNYNVVATINDTNYSGGASGTLTIAKVTPVFSNLSAPTINYGATPTSLGGTLKSGTLIPTGTTSITLNGVTQTPAIDSNGNFNSSFVTASLLASGSPYTINYVYWGDANFNSTSDSTKILTVVQPYLAWDVNTDGSINVLDMISVSQHTGETGTPGWIRQDVNGDGVVSVLDLIMIGQHWAG